MKGFKNMKKIVAVLVLALVAMTAVFAATAPEKVANGNDEIRVYLNIAGKTEFAFTTDSIVSSGSFDGLLAANQYDMAEQENESLKFYASVISTNQAGVDLKIHMPKNLVSGTGATIAIQYTAESKSGLASETDTEYVREFTYTSESNEKFTKSELIDLSLADHTNNV